MAASGITFFYEALLCGMINFGSLFFTCTDSVTAHDAISIILIHDSLDQIKISSKINASPIQSLKT